MRYVVVIVGLLLVIGTLGLVKFSQIASLIAMGKEAEKSGPPPEAVGSAKAQAESWEGTLSAVGTVAGAKSVPISNDAAGRVKRIRFESGDVVKQGQVLVELDAGVERAQLATAKSRRDLAQVTVTRSRALVAESVLAKAQLDNDEAQLRTANAEIATLQAQIDRKIVRAPFKGKLGIRTVNMGQYVNPGTPLTTLEEDGAVFVDFTLPQQQLAALKENMPVRITIEGEKDTVLEGLLSAVDPAVDATTRNVKLRASVPNKDDKLRTGMFVNVAVVTPNRGTVVTVPMTAVVHASYGDSVFVIEDKKPGAPGMTRTPDGKPVKVARQQFVRLGERRGDFVAIVDGLKGGEEIVSAGAFKLRNNSPIVIDNSVKPEPKLNPQPENR
jgi:membrane fusion protein (multidrug efflux system)